MTAKESAPQTDAAEYRYPDESQLARVPRELAQFVCETMGYRRKAIEEQDAVLEPLQPGVVSYPPVVKRKNPVISNYLYKP